MQNQQQNQQNHQINDEKLQYNQLKILQNNQQINQNNIQYTRFYQFFQKIQQNSQNKDEKISIVSQSICQYSRYLVNFQSKDQTFFQHAVQNKFIALLLKKLKQFKFVSQIVKSVFSSLELLLKAIKKDDQFTYLMVCINKQGFVQTNYSFEQQQDSAYYANFLKILIRKINQDIKYLNIFFNVRQPQFPLLLNLLKFYNSKDQILKTSVNLTLIQVCNNLYKPIQNFISNFPFVIFYPLNVYQIQKFFFQAVQFSQDKNKQQNSLENLKNSLKFMEDFLIDKDRIAIQMYTNCFMIIIGRQIYKRIINKKNKNQNKLKLMLKFFYSYLLKDLKVLKVRIGLSQIFKKTLNKKLKQFFTAKTSNLQLNYWLIDECYSDIHQHCLTIYSQEMNMPKKLLLSSFLKSLNSYIPRTKVNWLFHQIKKISLMLGFEIQLNKSINRQKYLQGSYIQALELHSQRNLLNKQMIDQKDQVNNMIEQKIQQVYNQVYSRIISQQCQQILFYYLKIIQQLQFPKYQKIQQQSHNRLVIDLLLKLHKSTSLSLIRAYYQLILTKWLTNPNKFMINQTQHPQLKDLFDIVLQKLVYYIMAQGWDSFINRIKRIQIDKQTNQQFSPDIFRDLQCDILYFVILRHLLGTQNQSCNLLNHEDNFNNISNKDMITKQIRTKCNLISQSIQNNNHNSSKLQSQQQTIQIVLDGIYLKLLSLSEQNISKQPLIVNKIYVYESSLENMLEIVQKQNTKQQNKRTFFCVDFKEKVIKDLIYREIKYRKQIIMDIQLKLRVMKFQFKFNHIMISQ